MAEKHADMSPSRLSRILACPASFHETVGLPAKRSSSYAEEGKMLHEAVAEVIDVQNEDALVHLTKEQRGLVGLCVEYLGDLIDSLGHSKYSVAVERKVSLDSWGIPEVYGTADIILRDHQNNHVHVIDWKFGQGVMVDAFENPQLLAYGAGAVGWPTKALGITVHVFQPRLDHVSRFSMKIMELYDWVHNTLARGILLALSPNPSFHPGESQCRWCDAKTWCKARADHANEVAVAIFKNSPANPNKVDMATLLHIHSQAPMIKQYLKDIHAFLHGEAEHGRDIRAELDDGTVLAYKLVEGRANRKFDGDEDEVADTLINDFGLDPEDIFVTELKSPAQIEKAAPKLKKDKAFAAMVIKPKGKVTLVPDTDARQAIAPPKTIDVFAGLAEDPATLE